MARRSLTGRAAPPLRTLRLRPYPQKPRRQSRPGSGDPAEKKGADWELKLEPPVNRILPISRNALKKLLDSYDR